MKSARSVGRRTSSARKQPNRLSIGVFDATAAIARLLRRAARKALVSHGVKGGRLEISLVGNPQMSRLHGVWKRDRRTTDVLTFDLREKRSRAVVEGEVIVCRDVARIQARKHGNSLAAELALYVVHGCLHLVGFDDTTQRQADRMHQQEDKILESLGLGRVYSGPAARE
jgi:probable rRNA maturation factor